MSPWFSALKVREVDHQLIRDDQSLEAWFDLKIREKCISYKAFPNNQKYEICTNSNTHRVMIVTSAPDGHAQYLSLGVLKPEQKESARAGGSYLVHTRG